LLPDPGGSARAVHLDDLDGVAKRLKEIALTLKSLGNGYR